MDEEWQQVLNAETGHVFLDYYVNGVRALIMRGPASLCAYVGITMDHPLAGFSYDDISLQCHGGLTYADTGGKTWPEGYYWYGWDYAHSGDRSTYSDLRPSKFDGVGEKRWTVAEVKEEIWSVTYDFAKIKNLAEKIVSKRYRIAEQKEPSSNAACK